MALSELMKTTQNQINIEKLHFRPFNQLELETVYVNDLKGDTLLFVENLSTKFDLFKLLENQLVIKSVDLDNFTINVNKDSLNADFNFQFLIDAFASETPDTTSTSNLFIQIKDVALKNGRLKYDIFSEPFLEDNLFDANHIHIYDFGADMNINSIDIEKLDVSLNQLFFKEISGFDVTNFQLKISSLGKKMNLKNLTLNLPHSQLSILEAKIDYTGLSLDSILNGGKYELKLGENWIYPGDLSSFYPDLNSLSENLTFSGNIAGISPEINIPEFQVDYGKHLDLNFQAMLGNFNEWQNAPLKIVFNRFSLDSFGLEEIMYFTSQTKKIPVQLGSINLSGTINGIIPDLRLSLLAQTDRGSVQVAGNGGYNSNLGTSHFDALLKSEHFDVGTLLQDTLLGLTSFQLDTKGNLNSSGTVSANGNINIERFDFNGYSYNRIQASAIYQGDSIYLDLNSDDNNVLLNIQAQANIGKKTPSVKMKANIDCIFLDELHFLSGYQDAFLTAFVEADIQGFNPEKMKANLAIDSLAIYTDKGAFLEPHFRFAYQATDSSSKQLDISSRIIKAYAKGNFTYAGIIESMKETFPMLFPKSKLYPKNRDLFAENLNFRIGMNEVNSLSDILTLPKEVPDSILFMGRYSKDGPNMKLSASAYTLFTESDTLQLSLSLSNRENNLAVIFNVDNKSTTYDLDGSIDAEIEFIPVPGNYVPDMNIALNPTVFVFNETDFSLNPAKIEVREGRYTIHDLSLNHADDVSEYVKIDGSISASREDSIRVDVSQFRLGTVFGAMKADVPLSGIVNGQIVARNLLSTPFILSRGFSLNDIVLSGNSIGDLKIISGWSSERNGLALRATLSRENHLQSVVSGFVLPEKDSISVTANIRDIELKWLESFTKDVLFGLEGDLSADIKMNGKISTPTINGMAYFNDAKVGVNMLNTLYSINDSIYITPKSIDLKQFTVLDEKQHPLIANGKITHQQFSDLNPNISIQLNDFQLINNEKQTDNLFYGEFRVNGNLNVKKERKNWVLSGDLNPTRNSKIMVNLPPSVTSAQRHNSITFINQEKNDLAEFQQKNNEEEMAPFPLKINLALLLDPSLSVGAVFNLATGDVAQVAGKGSINFSYDMITSVASLTGDYEITSGRATLSLANLTKKTFTVQEGGKLVFRGDPMATTFDITALYDLRADLVSLDPSFGNIGLSTTKLPVTCSVTASGGLDNMSLKYNVLLPNESADIQRRVDNFLYTDELKIREIASLLAFGTFLPPDLDNMTGNTILTSLGTSSLNSMLNNLLFGSLGDNWSIGTGFSTNDSGLNDMDVNVSTRLFNNRLMVNGTVGYHNDPNQTDNFTGDFDIQYRLTPYGNIVLKVYNETNNRYYERAKTTQGVGVIYKKDGRTFKSLFDKMKRK